MSKAANDYFDYYLDGKPVRGSTPDGSQTAPAANLNGWIARGGSLTFRDGIYAFTPDKQAKASFLAVRNQCPADDPQAHAQHRRRPRRDQLRTAEDKDFARQPRGFPGHEVGRLQTHGMPCRPRRTRRGVFSTTVAVMLKSIAGRRQERVER
jgi:hypothetical protein